MTNPFTLSYHSRFRLVFKFLSAASFTNRHGFRTELSAFLLILCTVHIFYDVCEIIRLFNLQAACNQAVEPTSEPIPPRIVSAGPPSTERLLFFQFLRFAETV